MGAPTVSMYRPLSSAIERPSYCTESNAQEKRTQNEFIYSIAKNQVLTAIPNMCMSSENEYWGRRMDSTDRIIDKWPCAKVVGIFGCKVN